MVEFDVKHPFDYKTEEVECKLKLLIEDSNEALTDEMYDTFSGYFTKKECKRALLINKDDFNNAAQWLVEEGEKERGKKYLKKKSEVLLA